MAQAWWAQGDLRGEVTASGLVPVVLLVVVVVLLLAAIGAFGRGRRVRRRAAGLLLVASVAWVVFNGPIEGAVLLTVTRTHGLTVADLLGILGFAVAVAVLVRSR